MKLILTRHGETIENVKSIWQGHLPGKLSKKGKEQAKKVANRLKNEKINAIYSSDLARAKDTAIEISKFHPETPIHLIKELREGDLGSITGKKKYKIDWNNPPKGIENRESMRKRVKKLLDKVYKKHPNDTIIFVGHNGINKALITAIMGKHASHMKKIDNQYHTAINVFEITEDKDHKIHLLNCNKHLK